MPRRISGISKLVRACADAPVERRAWPRIAHQLPVLVLNLEDALDDPYLGRIVDYSHGGICLELPGVHLDEGTVLGIRPPSAAHLKELPHWAEVQVRYRCGDSRRPRHGCRFLHRIAQSPRRPPDPSDADATQIDILGFAER
jgi:PilZ domain-containing protein